MIYVLVKVISLWAVSDYECQFQTVPASIHQQKNNLTVGLSSATGSQLPTQNNVRYNLMCTTSYEDGSEPKNKKNRNIRSEFQSQVKLKQCISASYLCINIVIDVRVKLCLPG